MITRREVGGHPAQHCVVARVQQFHRRGAGHDHTLGERGHRAAPACRGRLVGGQQPMLGLPSPTQQPGLDLAGRPCEERPEQRIGQLRGTADVQHTLQPARDPADQGVAVAGEALERLDVVLLAEHRAPAPQLERRGYGVGAGGLLQEQAADGDPRPVEGGFQPPFAEPPRDDACPAVGEQDAEAGVGELQGELVEHRRGRDLEPAAPVDVHGRLQADARVRPQPAQQRPPPGLGYLGPQPGLGDERVVRIWHAFLRSRPRHLALSGDTKP
ncbi:hypothetical protein [Streptomyces chartreusis]|uniref:hypothetical protein n=1 Tax=Streptomyces chartreusis TaxID=1969 RepID=UPI0036744F7B